MRKIIFSTMLLTITSAVSAQMAQETTPYTVASFRVSEISGQQMQLNDQTVGLSGFWKWIANHDNFNIGTEMAPESGTSPLFLKDDGKIYAEASMEIGPEPEWTQAAADAGLLKYPSASISMFFLADGNGVNFNTLGIRSLRISMKASGPIRMSILNKYTAEENGEPGIYVPVSSEYVTTTYDLTPYDMGVKGFDDDNFGGLPDWVNKNEAPEGTEIVTAVTGLKWEVKDSKGGIGELSIKSIEFLDGSGNVINPTMITGVEIKTGINAVATASAAAKLTVSGMNIYVEEAKANSSITVFDLQGKLITSAKAIFGNATVSVPAKGIYIVSVDGNAYKVNVK